MVSLNTAWGNLTPFLHRGDLVSRVRALLWLWRGDTIERNYVNFRLLAEALEAATSARRDVHVDNIQPQHANLVLPANEPVAAASGRRENYFFQRDGEDRNIHTVIHTSRVPQSCIGTSQPGFFQNLGHPGNKPWDDERFSSRALAVMMNDDFIKAAPGTLSQVVQGLKRRAEQEYLLQNLVKGAMFEAAEIADRFGMGIAVRGTGLLAHMGIEAGSPTKAQEFKNKTSKEIDLWLCDELDWSDLGAVVHYDPRLEWSSREAARHAAHHEPPMFRDTATLEDWRKKWAHIDTVRRAQLRALGGRIRQQPTKEDLRKKFFDRSEEYMAEDKAYRRGEYAPHTLLEGARIRLRIRSAADMVGDHDLFLFTQGDEYGVVARAGVANIQTALQDANTFQAQHGGIWYWEPSTVFNINIRNVIMVGHSPNGAEPLVYIQPGRIVSAAYYIPAENRLRSVWHDPSWTKWMSTTHSGALLLNPPGDL